jgi:superfamily II DNA or RNA helicase
MAEITVPAQSLPIELRDYQRDSIEAVREQLVRHRSTLLVLATGLGKTVTFSAIAKLCAVRGKRVLVVAHRGELLEQAAATLRRFGLSVAIEQGAQRVDPAALPDVVVASVQTLRGPRLERFAPDAFGLVVIDEAHHATAVSYRALFKYFGAAKVLGVTATPDRADGVGLRAVFKSVAKRIDLADGIAGGWLSPLDLRTVRVGALDLSNVRTVAGDFAAGELEQELLRDGVLHQVAAPLAELSAGRQTLVFVAGVKQAHALAEVLTGYGVRAAAVDGSMSPEKRAGVLEAYRSGRLQAVCNAMLWTEGFDAPETSCVALARPTRSRALLVQMIGRGTRLAPGKASCLVLDFVPGTLAKGRLAGPADALAGAELPEDVAALVMAASGLETGRLDALIANARAEREQYAALVEIEQAQDVRRLIERVGFEYAAPRLDADQLLKATRMVKLKAANDTEIPATAKDIARLRELGFDVNDDLSLHDYETLMGVVRKRQALRLCTIRQARKLRSYGLRDDVTYREAAEAMSILAANNWAPPLSLLLDPRFNKQREDGSSRPRRKRQAA